MKEWAKQFYKGRQWEEVRRAYLMSQHYLCERCGEPAKVVHHRRYLTRENINNPSISLAWNNLEALCQDCHNKEHHAAERKIRYKFDENGNILPR